MLGHGELFRPRATAGAAVRGLEVYTGYEYLDADAAAFNGLIAGVRVWF